MNGIPTTRNLPGMATGIAMVAVLVLSLGCTPSTPKETTDPPTTSAGEPRPEESVAGEPVAVAPMPSFVPACKVAPPGSAPAPDQFTFVVFGDSQNQSCPDEPVLQYILNDMMALNPAFAVSLGDVIVGENPKHEDEFAADLEGWCGRAAASAVPVYNAPGNHELVLWNKDHGENPVQALLTQYQKLVGPLYGFFDYGDSRFLVLNTDAIPEGGEDMAGAGEHSYVGPTQRAQLEQAVLDAEKAGMTHVFLMSHYPLRAASEGVELTASSAQPIRQFLEGDDAKGVVAFVVGSHDHRFWQPDSSDAAIPPHAAGDGPRYLVTGGAGAGLDPGAYFHYLSFRVQGTTVTAQVHQVPPPSSSQCPGSSGTG